MWVPPPGALYVINPMENLMRIQKSARRVLPPPRVRRGKVKEPSQFSPFLPNFFFTWFWPISLTFFPFSEWHSLILPDFFSVPDFLPFFSIKRYSAPLNVSCWIHHCKLNEGSQKSLMRGRGGTCVWSWISSSQKKKKKSHNNRVVFQDQAMYARTSFTGALRKN